MAPGCAAGLIRTSVSQRDVGSSDGQRVVTNNTTKRGEQNKVAAGAVKDIKDFIGVSCKVNVKNVGEVPRSQGKAVWVVDHRK